jgi:signal transduction histidine kinase/putative methionine-R-sulfoxide reductase with GAF domain
VSGFNEWGTAQVPAVDLAPEWSVLDEIAQKIGQHLTSPERMWPEVYSVLGRALGVVSFHLFLCGQEEPGLCLTASWTEGERTDPGWRQEVCARVMRTGQVYNTEDTALGQGGAQADPDLVHSELSLPLIIDPEQGRSQQIGVLQVGRRGKGAFSQQDERLFETIGRQIGWAIHLGRQYGDLEQAVCDSEFRIQEHVEQLRVERDRADFLYHVAQEMTFTLELDRVLNRALARVGQALQVTEGSILLLDPESDDLIYRAAMGRPIILPKGGKRTRFRRGVGLAGWVLEHNMPALIGDLEADPRWVIDPDKAGQTHSALAVPLGSEEEVLGVILLFHPQRDYFRQEHVWWVVAAAHNMTAAIKNAELYQLVREQAARLGQMLREQRSISSQHMAILSAIADGVAVCDERDRILVVNDAVAHVMRPPVANPVGQPAVMLLDGFSAEHQDAALAAMKEVKERFRGRPRTDPIYTTIDRDKQTVQASFTPMVDERNNFMGTVIVFRDVTVEQEVARAKNEFISTVAHELRTPMTSIKGYADLLLRGAMGTLNDGQRRFMEIVKSNVDRMSTLVADLLDMSRIEAGRIRLELAAIDMGQAILEVRDSVIETIKDRKLELSLDISPNLPPVLADHNRVIQILSNLLSNAYRYTLEGGSITVSAYLEGDAVRVDVADTGIGISEQDQEGIMERFYRANHPVVSKQPGTGLGLAIVKSLVELQGGKLWFVSELGRGSTFSFTMPLYYGGADTRKA